MSLTQSQVAVREQCLARLRISKRPVSVVKDMFIMCRTLLFRQCTAAYATCVQLPPHVQTSSCVHGVPLLKDVCIKPCVSVRLRAAYLVAV